jgi:hypothetical protein
MVITHRLHFIFFPSSLISSSDVKIDPIFLDQKRKPMLKVPMIPSSFTSVVAEALEEVGAGAEAFKNK